MMNNRGLHKLARCYSQCTYSSLDGKLVLLITVGARYEYELKWKKESAVLCKQECPGPNCIQLTSCFEAMRLWGCTKFW